MVARFIQLCSCMKTGKPSIKASTRKYKSQHLAAETIKCQLQSESLGIDIHIVAIKPPIHNIHTCLICLFSVMAD